MTRPPRRTPRSVAGPTAPTGADTYAWPSVASAPSTATSSSAAGFDGAARRDRPTGAPTPVGRPRMSPSYLWSVAPRILLLCDRPCREHTTTALTSPPQDDGPLPYFLWSWR